MRHNDIMALPLSQMLWMKVRNFLRHDSEATHTEATLFRKASAASKSGVASGVRRLYGHGRPYLPVLSDLLCSTAASSEHRLFPVP